MYDLMPIMSPSRTVLQTALGPGRQQQSPGHTQIVYLIPQSVNVQYEQDSSLFPFQLPGQTHTGQSGR